MKVSIENLLLNYKNGDLFIVNPDINYDIDWIMGRTMIEDDPYYFDISEPCILLEDNLSYIYVLVTSGKIVKTYYREVFIKC